MKERPILFNAEMVRAVLDGRKTQTRRVVKFPVKRWQFMEDYHGEDLDGWLADTPDAAEWCGWGWCEGRQVQNTPHLRCPYGARGDKLWVRETWRIDMAGGSTIDGASDFSYDVSYRAGGDDLELRHAGSLDDDPYIKTADSGPEHGWRPSIFMPRWASRITLEVAGVRVERVQEITHDDALAEGISTAPIDGFADLWGSINDKRGYSWDSNPWVWVVEFKVI